MSNNLIGKISQSFKGRSLKFCIDYADSENISGWIVDLKHSDEPVVVQLRHEGDVISSVIAGDFRQDLLEAGIGNGYSGFHFKSQELDVYKSEASIDLFADGKKLNNDPIFIKFEERKAEFKDQEAMFLEGVRQEVNEIKQQIIQCNMNEGLPVDSISGVCSVFVERMAELTFRLSVIEKTLVDKIVK